MLYNFLWTSFHCLFGYLFEQDANDEIVYTFPVLFKAGQKGKYFSIWIFWRWIVFSIYHGVVVFYGTIYGTEESVNPDGKVNEHWFKSTLCFTIVLHIVMYKMFLETVYWNSVSIIFCLLCFFLYYGIIFFGSIHSISVIFQDQINGIAFQMFGTAKFWLIIIVAPIIALLPDITYMLGQRIFFPTPTDIVMHHQKKQNVQDDIVDR
mmetsp:Transcript_28576/g.27560  ORF Transcript_28576/g.27560 Transcript_28576/m.27560 type:complete len:207 (+) Transcript_28576:2924-3544(+)